MYKLLILKEFQKGEMESDGDRRWRRLLESCCNELDMDVTRMGKSWKRTRWTGVKKRLERQIDGIEKFKGTVSLALLGDIL